MKRGLTRGDAVAIVAADLDGDGRTDLAVANDVADTVGVYRATNSAQVASVAAAAATLSATGTTLALTAGEDSGDVAVATFTDTQAS